MAGELITGDYQFEFRSLLFGDGTSYLVGAVSGLDMPEMRTSDTNRPRTHGEFAGLDLHAGRTITFDMEVEADTASALRTLLDALETATTRGASEEALVVKLPGREAMRALVRPRRRAVPVDMRFAVNFATAAVQFHATDPRLYSNTEDSSTVELPTPSGGMTFPATFPLTFGTVGTSGTIQAANDGNFPTPWVARIDGGANGVDNPRIEHVGTGQVLDLNGLTVAAGDYVLLDSKERTVLLNGTASRYGNLTAASEWFDLAPGANEVRYQANTAKTGSTMTLTHRSAWV